MRIADTSSLPSYTGSPARYGVSAVGGCLTSIGFAGIALTTVLYALAPPAAGLPVHPFDLQAALNGTVAGAVPMRAAGCVGVVSDVVAVMGAMLVMVHLAARDEGFGAAGWAGMLLSVLIFTVVDTMVGFVLVPLADSPAMYEAFAAQKRLFDALFQTGTIAFGVGAVIFFAREYYVHALALGRFAVAAGLGIGLLTLVASFACLAGAPVHLALGLLVGAAGVLFARLGIVIAAGRSHAV